MNVPLLPSWSRVLWAAALAVVLAFHLVHAARMRGQVRVWHVGHILMAAGMIAMYLFPQATHATPYRAGGAAFAILAVAAALYVAGTWRRAHGPSWPWLASTIDMGVMAYMSLPAGERPAEVTYVVIAYLIVEAALWLTARVPAPGAVAVSSAGPTECSAAERGSRTSTATGILTRSMVALWRNRPESDMTVGVRITLAVMSLSMAWMLLAMQAMRAIGAGGTG